MDMQAPLPYLGGLSAEEFLRDYWQKKPLVVRGAFPELAYRLSPEDLMELAQEEGVEARIVLEQGKTPWELLKGPFTAKALKQMPATHWTLLVQAVDHYLPELADYLDHFSFIPNWRIDDIMVSYAPEGGSVGPHYDLYDVFLIQGIGQRRWQLGQQCDENSPRVEGTSLRILQNIDTHFDEILNPGDLLYVPPALAHYGVAQNDCCTYSIGFRAPVLGQVLDRLVEAALENPASQHLFADTDRKVLSQPAALHAVDIEKLRQQVLPLLNDNRYLERALAAFLSEPKYDDYEPMGEELRLTDIQALLAQNTPLRRDPASHMIYTLTEGQPAALFINGEEMPFPPRLAPLVALLANHRLISSEQLTAWHSDEEALTWLAEQIAMGFWFFEAA